MCWLRRYPSGGYILDFQLDYNNITKGIRDMAEHGWVDDATRVVFVEFLVGARYVSHSARSISPPTHCGVTYFRSSYIK